MLLLSACNVGPNPKEHLSEIYTLALDVFMEEDAALNSDMAFIAIDMSNFNELADDDKEAILNYFEDKYDVEVMDATFEELQEMGLFDQDEMVLDGVLLSLETVTFKFNNHIFFEGSKYRSALGAVGGEVTVHYKNNEWKVKESKMTWIS